LLPGALLAAACLLAVPAGASANTACNGSAELCDRPFNETVFVGTHNSMAADNYGWNAAITTQTYTISEQLQRGVRALSFDVWYGSRNRFTGFVSNADGPTRSGVEPYLCHSYCLLGARRLETGLQDVVSFLNANPREVVSIYFEDYVSVPDLQRVVESSGLMPFVQTGPLDRTLGQMISSGKRVVLISQNVGVENQTAWYPRLTSVGRDTDYDFSSTSRLTDPANLARSCEPTPWGRSGNGRFFVMQHFITNVIASRDSSRVVNAKDVLTRRALACRDLRGVLPSVLLVDYFELGDPQGAARELNALYRAPAGAPGGSTGSGGSDESNETEGGSGAPGESGGGPGGDVGIAAPTTTLRPGSSMKVVLTVTNPSKKARTITVRLRDRKGDGVSHPERVRVRVPGQGSARVDITVRANGKAKGTVPIVARYGKKTARLRLTVR
jgi:hypothetical protein